MRGLDRKPARSGPLTQQYRERRRPERLPAGHRLHVDKSSSYALSGCMMSFVQGRMF